MANKPEENAYKSAYSSAIDDLVNKAVNRQAFEYDPATDAAYQSYAKQYARLGNEAAQDTLADVAANTGGMASSYATTAAQQARNNYNQALTDKIPALMEAAYNKYRNEYNDTLAGISTLQGLDDSMYNRFATDRSYNRGVYENDRDYERGVLESDRSFNEDKRRYDQDYARRVFESDRDYEQAAKQWEAEFGLSRDQFNEAIRQFNQNFGYQQQRDQVADQQWAAQFAEDTRRYNQDYAYQQGRDQTQDAQWQKEFDEKTREYDQNFDLDKDSAEFEKMLNTWATLGYANKAIAKYFGVKEGTKTNEAAYQAAQLALDKKALAKSGRSGRSGGSGRRYYGRSGSGYQSQEDKYGKYVETPTEGVYKDSPYNQALHIASQKLNNGASDEQIINYLNTVKGLSDTEIDKLKQALGLGGNQKDYHTYKDPYTGKVNAYNF